MNAILLEAIKNLTVRTPSFGKSPESNWGWAIDAEDDMIYLSSFGPYSNLLDALGDTEDLIKTHPNAPRPRLFFRYDEEFESYSLRYEVYRDDGEVDRRYHAWVLLGEGEMVHVLSQLVTKKVRIYDEHNEPISF